MESLRYILHQQIDKEKWDACINKSVNGLIYAQSFYLDTMAAHWDAIVLNDYEGVMPLTWKKKWGITYLYQPAFFQQGGIFSSKEITAEMIQAFVDKACNQFKFAEFTFNYRNDVSKLQEYNSHFRNNYVLHLNKPYEEILALYHTSILKDLKRIKKSEVVYDVVNDYADVLTLYKKLYKERIENWSDADLNNFESLCKKQQLLQKLVVRKVSNNKNEIVAAAILFNHNNRLYNFISCITPEGRHLGANHFLYDKLIEEFSNSNYMLDFEGSDIKGVAEFYSRFPVVNEKYPFVKWNNLPWWAKLFKK